MILQIDSLKDDYIIIIQRMVKSVKIIETCYNE